MYPYFELFGRTIGTYAIAALIGFAFSALLIWRLCRTKGIGDGDVILLVLSMAIGVFLGGKLLYGLTQWPLIVEAFGSLTSPEVLFSKLQTAFNGMVFYGGFFGSLGAVWLYTHFNKSIATPFAMELMGLVTPLFHTFGRIGCFFAGCCYGIPCQWGITISGNHLIPELNDVSRLPIQLIEAGANLLIFGILAFLYGRNGRRPSLLSLYTLLYAPLRFVLEFFRGDEIRGIWLGLSTSQWISLGLVIVVLLHLLLSPSKTAIDSPSTVKYNTTTNDLEEN